MEITKITNDGKIETTVGSFLSYKKRLDELQSIADSIAKEELSAIKDTFFAAAEYLIERTRNDTRDYENIKATFELAEDAVNYLLKKWGD